MVFYFRILGSNWLRGRGSILVDRFSLGRLLLFLDRLFFSLNFFHFFFVFDDSW